LAVFFVTAHLGLTTVSAQEIKHNKEKVVTGTIQLMTPGSVKILDGYISDQLYTGGDVFTGLNVKLGALYKKQDRLSWNLYFTGFNRAKWLEELGEDDLPYLTNPSGSQHLKYSSFNFGYGTYYHWYFGKKLMVKAGGMFDVYGAMKTSTPDGTNNNLNFDAQMLFKGHAAIKYGWDFKKWALDLRARVSLPLVGIMAADHPSEPLASILLAKDTSVLNPAFRHIFLASYHNYMSLDYEMGIDFVLKPFTLSLGIGSTGRWWNVYDIQNIRRINYTTLGISFDIVSRDKFKSSNKNF
jgi:hypothetical protein